MLMTMMMMMESRRREMDEDEKKKEGGDEEEETRLKESQPTCRRPRSTFHCHRLCVIRAFLYYSNSDCERN